MSHSPAHHSHVGVYYAYLAMLSSCRGRVRTQTKLERVATRLLTASGYDADEARHVIDWV